MVGSFNLLFLIHLLALSAAGSALFGEAIVKAHMDTQNDALGRKLRSRLEMVGGIGFAVLILSGLTMLWTRGYDLRDMGGWFWVKMVLLAAVFVGAWLQSRLTARSRSGDDAAARLGRGLDWIMRGLFVAVIAAAVMTFG